MASRNLAQKKATLRRPSGVASMREAMMPKPCDGTRPQFMFRSNGPGLPPTAIPIKDPTCEHGSETLVTMTRNGKVHRYCLGCLPKISGPVH